MITQEQLYQFIRSLSKKPDELRLGQYFCNMFGVTNPQLFYCTNDNEVWSQINKLVEA